MTGAERHLYIWNGSVLYVTPSNVAELHAHYACSILLACDRDFEIHSAFGSVRTSAAILGPNLEHELRGETCAMAVLQLDPDSHQYSRVAAILKDESFCALDGGRFEPVLGTLRSALRGDLDCLGARQFFAAVLNCLGPTRQEQEPPPLDPRIASILDDLRRDLPDSVMVEEIAGDVGLSPSRFMHLFNQEMGLPLRRYLLWLRLRRSALLMKQGITLTEAAHAAGFSDSAHLSRTFKEMFGIPPSYFLGKGSGVQVWFCD